MYYLSARLVSIIKGGNVMIWFFVIVFMVQGISPVQKRIVEYPAGKQACESGRKELKVKLNAAGTGYMMTTCKPKVKEGK